MSPRRQRVTVAGNELDGLAVTEPAASIRLLLPSAGRTDLVLPTWNGNEFLLPDGARPAIRTLTPSLRRADDPDLTLDIVIHGRGLLTEWAETVAIGSDVAVSGPGRGYAIATDATRYVLGGDESALPALTQVLDAIPTATPVHVAVEAVDRAAITRLARRDGVTVEIAIVDADATPGAALVELLATAPMPTATRVWVAGEAAAVQRIRRICFEARAVPRAHCTIRGYWKAGRDGVDGT